MPRTCALVLVILALGVACGEEAKNGTGDALDQGPAEGMRRIEPSMAFTFDLPEDWELSTKPPQNDSMFHYLSAEDGDATPDFRENIGFRRVEAPDDASAEQLLEEALAALPNGIALVEDDARTLTIDGHRFLRRRYRRASSVRSYVVYYVVPSPGVGYRITGTTPDASLDTYGPLFDGIVKSMRFTSD